MPAPSPSKILNVRVSDDLNNRLQAAATMSGESVSQLLRAAAERVVDDWVGPDPDAAVKRAEEITRERMRRLLGSTRRDADGEVAGETLSYVVAELSRRISAVASAGGDLETLEQERDAALADKRHFDPRDRDCVTHTLDRYAKRAKSLRDTAVMSDEASADSTPPTGVGTNGR